MFQRILDFPSDSEEKETEKTEVVANKELLNKEDTTSVQKQEGEKIEEKKVVVETHEHVPTSSSSSTSSASTSSASTSSASTSSASTSSASTSSASTSTEVKEAEKILKKEEFQEEKKKVEVRAALEGGVPEPPTKDPYYDETFGCGMSGGGIRSAAFCSGVLWALMNQSMLPPPNTLEKSIQLPRGKIPRFYSCVSGGGYIGASFLWWARCHGGGDPRAWQKEYFGRMKRGIGYYIDFMHPRQAVLDIAQLLTFILFLICSGTIAFFPTTYMLCEMILMPYSIYFNTLQADHDQADRKIHITLQGLDLGTALGTDIAWLLFLLVLSGIPVFKILHLVFKEISLVELETEFLSDGTNSLKLTKTLREMFANLYWYLLNIFSTFAFVVLCDFSQIVHDDDEVDVYHSAIADSLRIVILAIVFSRNPDLIANFIQAQVIIWAYWPPHHFFGKADTNFEAHYRVFAIICKVLLPFSAVTALFRERAVFEFGRYRILKAFFDSPVGEPALNARGAVLGPRFGVNSPRKLFWTPPDQTGHYPVYISGTTVNKWMVTPKSKDLFPKEALLRELEARFYFKNMPSDLQPRIERILNNGEDRVGRDQEANEWVIAATATESDPKAPLFFKQNSSSDRTAILTFLQQTVRAHASDTNSVELTETDLFTKFGYIPAQVKELLTWLKDKPQKPKRRLSLPQTDAAKRFIGEENGKFIASAIQIARDAMLARPEFRAKAVEFESTKEQVATALRRSLRDLAWRNTNPDVAGYDILALTSEGWWERYEAGLNEPIFILPPPISKTEETVHDKLDALIGANPDLLLSEAMGMSAAVGSFARAIKKRIRVMHKSQVLFGLHMGRWVNTTSLHWTVQFAVMLILELLLCLPIIIWGGIHDPFVRTNMREDTGANDYNYLGYAGGTATVLLYGLWAFVLPVMKTSKFYPFFPHSRITSTLSGEDVWDNTIPAMLYLSDGGHTENLGLLPLLTRRLKWIVLACGSDEECLALHSALDQARCKLGVSFRELKSDQRRRHVKRVANKELDLKSDIEFFARDVLQRILVFEVLYPRAIRSWKKSAGSFAPSTLDEPPQQKGYVFFMQAIDAHPKGFLEGEEPGPTDTPLGAECIEQLDHEHAPLNGCCCRCCHRLNIFRGIGGSFPYHSIAFQFFTPTLFDAYHAQGARAMKDALEIVLEHQVEKPRAKA